MTPNGLLLYSEINALLSHHQRIFFLQQLGKNRATVKHCVAYSPPNGMSPSNSSVFRKPLTSVSRKIQYQAGIEETNKTMTSKSLWLMLTLYIMAEQALHEFATDMVLELNIEVDAFPPSLSLKLSPIYSHM